MLRKSRRDHIWSANASLIWNRKHVWRINKQQATYYLCQKNLYSFKMSLFIDVKIDTNRSFNDCLEMAKAKWNYFTQSWKIFEQIELERCGLRRSLANLKGFNLVTDLLKIKPVKQEILVKTWVNIFLAKIVFTSNGDYRRE